MQKLRYIDSLFGDPGCTPIPPEKDKTIDIKIYLW